MKVHRWLGYLVMAAFAVRAATVFPLYPLEVVDQLTSGVPNMTPAMVADLEFGVWISLAAWLVLLPLGVAAGVMIIRQHSKWPFILFASAAIYLVFMPPWRWLSLHADLLRSAVRVEHFPAMWQKPGFVFDTLIFPLFVLIGALYAVYVMTKGKKRHAI